MQLAGLMAQADGGIRTMKDKKKRAGSAMVESGTISTITDIWLPDGKRLMENGTISTVAAPCRRSSQRQGGCGASGRPRS